MPSPLARALSDDVRAERYRVSILRGLRSLAQLTFKDDSDLLYVAKRTSVLGGVQTSEHNNVIRVDNVQHALSAIEKVLAAFSMTDYQAETRQRAAPG